MSKWAKRLKGTLVKDGFSATSLDSLLTKTAKTHDKVVSTAFVSSQSKDVTKFFEPIEKKTLLEKNETCLNSALTKADETEKVGVSSAFVSDESSLTTEISLLIIERLNQMITSGVSFDVAANDFQPVASDGLVNSQREFLAINRTAVLCTFQQALLMKHLFEAKPELLTKFIAKVNERDARFEAVCEITAKWFARLLDTMPDENIAL